MKKKLFLFAFLLSAATAGAQVRLRSIDNVGGTNIVLAEANAPARIEVTDAVFSNFGKSYKAKSIRCTHENGNATYRLVFRRFRKFKDCKVTITINGKPQTLDLHKQMDSPVLGR